MSENLVRYEIGKTRKRISWKCDCGGVMIYDGVMTDTTLMFAGIAYRCVKCGERIDYRRV